VKSIYRRSSRGIPPPAEQAGGMFGAGIKKEREREREREKITIGGWTGNSRKMMLKIWSNLRERTSLLRYAFITTSPRKRVALLGSISCCHDLCARARAQIYIKRSIYLS